MPAEALHADLQLLLDQYRGQRAFDAAKWADEKCELFNDYCRNAGVYIAQRMAWCGQVGAMMPRMHVIYN